MGRQVAQIPPIFLLRRGGKMREATGRLQVYIASRGCPPGTPTGGGQP
jgi:hypothetical protein